MKRTACKIAFLALVLALAMALAACTGLAGLFSPRESSGGNGGGYKITLALNGGTGVTANDFISGSKLVKPVAQPTRSGYNFAGWYSNEQCTQEVVFNVTITSDVKIYAKWTPRTPVATFSFCDGSEAIEVEASGGRFTPPEKDRAGYELAGWYKDSDLNNEADFEETAVDGARFYAKWTILRYVISYNYDGLGAQGAGAVNSYTVEDRVALVSPTAVADGYEFLYWADGEGNAVYEIAKGSIGNRSYKAVYRSGNNAVLAAVGGKIDGQNVAIGVRYSVTEIDFATALTISDRATLAVYDGDDLVEGAVALAVGTKAFRAEVTSESGVKNTYTVTVTRYDENDAVVTFHYPDDTSTNVGVAKGTAAEEPVAKNILKKDFVAWYLEDTYDHEYDFSDLVSEDLDLYARYDWTTYVISYNFGIGSAPLNAPEEYTAETGATLKDAVAPTGYSFNGYTDENGAAVDSVPVDSWGDLNLFAHYVKTGSSFLTSGFTASGQSLTKAQLVDYFNWAVATRQTEVSFTMSDACEPTYITGTGNNDSILTQVHVLVSSVGAEYHCTTSAGNVTNATVEFTYVEPNAPITNEDYYTQLGYNVHPAFVKTRANDFNDFAIDYIDTYVPVTGSDQLVYVTMMGYRPQPTAGSPAETMYAAARSVLRNIVDDSMTDLEKAHAIYHWLLKNVVYDAVLFANSNTLPISQLKTYNGFYLEGVFTDHRAVCDGISKAFALLCNIEGIPCVQVSGYVWQTDEHHEFVLDGEGHKVKGGGHAWNKVKIDGEWYVVDPTHGDTHLSGNEVVNHDYFMMTDEQRNETAFAEDYTDLIADAEYDIYEDITFTVADTEYDFVIESRAELTALITYFASVCASVSETQTIDVRIGDGYSYANITTELQNANGGFDFATYDLSYSGGKTPGDTLILIATPKE